MQVKISMKFEWKFMCFTVEVIVIVAAAAVVTTTYSYSIKVCVGKRQETTRAEKAANNKKNSYT